MTEKYHHAFGCYGIVGNSDELVVIKKLGGPYINRYDLPGGSLEDGEGLDKALTREVEEETNLKVTSFKQIGVTSFRYPWDYKKWQYNQHICVFYVILAFEGELQSNVKQFAGQDSLGAIRVPLNKLNIKNASPLVLTAKEYLLNPNRFNLRDQTFTKWEVLQKPIF